EPGTAADVPCVRPAVAEMHGRAIVRMADHCEQRAVYASSMKAELDERADDLSVLPAGERGIIVRVEPLGSRRADENGVVPCQFRDRLRQFLQPAVVRKTAVENRRIGAERHFE